MGAQEYPETLEIENSGVSEDPSQTLVVVVAAVVAVAVVPDVVCAIVVHGRHHANDCCNAVVSTIWFG